MSESLNNPITCAQARAAVSACVDGEAAELERAAARKHLQTCARCREFQAIVLQTRRQLRSAPVLEPSRSLRPAPNVSNAPVLISPASSRCTEFIP